MGYNQYLSNGNTHASGPDTREFRNKCSSHDDRMRTVKEFLQRIIHHNRNFDGHVSTMSHEMGNSASPLLHLDAMLKLENLDTEGRAHILTQPGFMKTQRLPNTGSSRNKAHYLRYSCML